MEWGAPEINLDTGQFSPNDGLSGNRFSCGLKRERECVCVCEWGAGWGEGGPEEEEEGGGGGLQISDPGKPSHWISQHVQKRDEKRPERRPPPPRGASDRRSLAVSPRRGGAAGKKSGETGQY